MPNSLPSATVTTAPGYWREYANPEKQHYVTSGQHVEPLFRGSDQDGFDTYHIICKWGQIELAIKREALRLTNCQ